MSANHIVRIIPVLKINNRHLNQEFFVNQLGEAAHEKRPFPPIDETSRWR